MAHERPATPVLLGTLEEQVAGSSPGMKQFGIQQLSIHRDAREDLTKLVTPDMVHDLSGMEKCKLSSSCSAASPACRSGCEPTSRACPSRAPCWRLAIARCLRCTAVNEVGGRCNTPLIAIAALKTQTSGRPALAPRRHMPMHKWLVAVLQQKLAAITSSRLNVWERREPCVPGRTYTFGPPDGLQSLEDTTYILAWMPLPADSVALLHGAEPQSPVPAAAAAAAWDASGDADGGVAAGRRHRATQLERIVAAVLEDDMEGLTRAVEAYGRLAEVGGAHHPRLSFLTASGLPLTAVAANLNCQPRLVLYLVAQGAEVDRTALRFILNNVKAIQTGGYRDVRHFMLSYLVHQRNPVASAMAFAQLLDEAALASSAKAAEYTALAKQLRVIAVQMVELLDKLGMVEAAGGGAAGGADGGAEAGADGAAGGGGAEGARAAATLPGAQGPGGGGGAGGGGGVPTTLADVLAPKGVACSVNDVSPLQIAYDTNDLGFMSASVVQGYLQDLWLGAEYIGNALQEAGNSIHYGDHHMVINLLESAGFVGSVGRQVCKYFSYLLHIQLLASRPFFDSPRGRWVFRLMCEAFFLYVFHYVQLLRDQEIVVWQHYMLVLYVASMIVDEYQEVRHQYFGRLAVYFQSGFNVVESACLLLLVASGSCKAAMLLLGEEHPAWSELHTAKEFMFNTTSIFVWSRLLQYVIPMYDGVGSLLMVISQMIREVLKFAVPGMILMMGVGFTMFATFRDRGLPRLETFPATLLLLFRTFLGETAFEVLEDEDDTLYNLYGNIIVLLYALTATVVLANLLIALISYHFQPDKVESQSRFQMAEILAHYEYMVEHQLIGAPFSLPLLVLVHVLPSGWRARASANSIYTAAIMPLDGNPVSGESRGSRLFPTGSRELPFLIYLLTLHPIIIALSWAMAWGAAPYCILFFALYGYRRWAPAAAAPPPEAKVAAAAAGGGGGGGKVAPEPHAGVPTPGEVAAAALSLVEVTAEGVVAAAAALGGGIGGEGGGVAAPSADLYPEWNTAQRMRSLASLVLRTLLFIVTRPLWMALAVLVYVVVLVVLVCMVWFGLYQWGGKLVYYSYVVLKGWGQ
ncbi:Short transient receptor potential channel 2, partial [Tetrabaena socialis]